MQYSNYELLLSFAKLHHKQEPSNQLSIPEMKKQQQQRTVDLVKALPHTNEHTNPQQYRKWSIPKDKDYSIIL